MALAHYLFNDIFHFQNEEACLSFLNHLEKLSDSMIEESQIQTCINAYYDLSPLDKHKVIECYMDEYYSQGNTNPIRHLLLQSQDPILIDAVFTELKVKGNYLDNVQYLVYSPENNWTTEKYTQLAKIAVEKLKEKEKQEIMGNNISRFPTLIQTIQSMRKHDYMTD